jgi:thiamine biosynthesis protein ThiS
MKVTVNGESREVGSGTSIFELLDSLALDPGSTVVERNGMVLQRELYESTLLEKGDVLELMRFVGGG